MNEFLSILHPPSWTILQTIGTGATLTLGHIIGKMAFNGAVNLLNAGIKHARTK